LGAPGHDVVSIDPSGQPSSLEGSSISAPFVTGTAALLWSLFPSAPAIEIRLALTGQNDRRRTSVIPPLLNAWAAYQTLASRYQPVVQQRIEPQPEAEAEAEAEAIVWQEI
jgi:subtilisin family serine protease